MLRRIAVIVSFLTFAYIISGGVAPDNVVEVEAGDVQYTLRLVGSYPVPQWGTELRSIAFDGENIWTSQDSSGWSSRIYKHNMDETLSVAEEFASSSTYLTGMTFVDGALWTSDNMTNQTVRYAVGDPRTEVARYGQPGLSDGAHGIAHDGEAFWLHQATTIVKVEYPSATLLASYTPEVVSCMGLEWDPARNCLWVLDNVPVDGIWTTLLRQFAITSSGLLQTAEYDLRPFIQENSSGNFVGAGLTVADGYIWICDHSNFKILKLMLIESVLALDIDEVWAVPGCTVRIPVAFSNTTTGLPTGLQVDILYNDSLLTPAQTSVEDGPAATDAGKNCTANVISPGRLRVVCAGLNTTEIQDGILFYLRFDVPSDPDLGVKIVLQGDEMQVTDASGDLITPTNVLDGAVTPGCPADVNRDGSENIQDVQLTVNAVLGLDISPFVADVNEDGETNIQDVQLVINCVLQLDPCPCPSCD